MTSVRMQQCAIHVSVEFAAPLLDWNGVATRFFSMIQRELVNVIQIKPLDFVERNGNSPGESEAIYRVFGGPSAITLSAEKLLLSFPNLVPSDFELLVKMMKAVDDGFSREFADYELRSIRCSFDGHADIADGNPVADYLDRYRDRDTYAASIFQNYGSAIYSQGTRFSVRDEEGKWVLFCLAEKSESVQNGLFLNLDATILELGTNDDFDTRLKRVLDLVIVCFNALKLEWNNEY